MKRVLVVGAGGLGRELYGWASQHPDCGRAWTLAGFLDDRPDALSGYDYPVGIVGSIREYQPAGGDLLLCGIGLPKNKKAVVELLLQRGAEFLTLIHPRATLGRNVRLGRGVAICPGAVVTCDVALGDFCLLNVNSSVGHNARIGAYCTLSGHCDVTGFAALEEGVFMGTHAAVIPSTKVGAYATIGAGSVAMGSVPAGATMMGVPARSLFD